jgi:transcription elongation factor GreA
MTSPTTLLTAEGLQKLQEELEHRKTDVRLEIAQRIQDAKELGDLSENAEYSAAKDDQAANEMRVMEIQEKLKNYQVITATDSDVVLVGSTITVQMKGNPKPMTLTIVGSSEADPMSQRISNESPMGQAFLGHATGDTVTVQAPAGMVEYTIVKIG